MIRPLRRTHRAAFAALAVLLPLLFALALRARPPDPRLPILPPEAGQVSRPGR